MMQVSEKPKGMPRLRAYLISNGIALRTFGRRLGVTSAAISQWISGANKPTALHMAKLTAATGLTEAELLAPEPRK